MLVERREEKKCKRMACTAKDMAGVVRAFEWGQNGRGGVGRGHVVEKTMDDRGTRSTDWRSKTNKESGQREGECKKRWVFEKGQRGEGTGGQLVTTINQRQREKP